MFEYIDFNAFLLTHLCSHNLKLCTVDFDLSHNLLTGTLPESIYNMTSMDWFGAYNNQFRGTISPSINKLEKISQFLVQDNQFTGTLPETLYDMSTMKKFKCSNNNLRGTISSNIKNLVDLTVLSIDNNLFRGTTPEYFLCLKVLRSFDFNIMN